MSWVVIFVSLAQVSIMVYLVFAQGWSVITACLTVAGCVGGAVLVLLGVVIALAPANTKRNVMQEVTRVMKNDLRGFWRALTWRR